MFRFVLILYLSGMVLPIIGFQLSYQRISSSFPNRGLKQSLSITRTERKMSFVYRNQQLDMESTGSISKRPTLIRKVFDSEIRISLPTRLLTFIQRVVQSNFLEISFIYRQLMSFYRCFEILVLIYFSDLFGCIFRS